MMQQQMGGQGQGPQGQQMMGGPSPQQQQQSQGLPTGAMIHPHSGHPGGGPQQQQQQQQQMHQGQERFDNISKAKSLVAPIKDTLSSVLRTAATCIYANNMIDSGS
jgi:hypothetical protein